MIAGRLHIGNILRTRRSPLLLSRLQMAWCVVQWRLHLLITLYDSDSL